MDNKSKISGAIGVVTTAAEVALQLSGWTSGPFATAVAAIALLALLYAAWHAINGWRIKRNRAVLRLEPIHLIAIGLVVAMVGVGWQLIRPPSKDGDKKAPFATSHQQTMEPKSDTSSEPPMPTRFYSQRNKDELADAITDLTNIFNGAGDDVVQSGGRALGTWNGQFDLVIRGMKTNMAALISQLQEVSDKTVILNRAIYDENGIIAKHKAYNDEIKWILRLPENSPNYNPISILQISLNNFRDGVTAIEMIEKYDDKRLVEIMVRGLEPARDNFIKGNDVFRAWFQGARQRAENLRNSLK